MVQGAGGLTKNNSTKSYDCGRGATDVLHILLEDLKVIG